MKNDNKTPITAQNGYTDLAHLGREAHSYHGFVNIPVYRGSTVLYRTAEDFMARRQQYTYAISGTPTSRHFEEAIAKLEGGHGAILTPSGLMAITIPLLAFLSAGDHLLMVDTVYRPTRNFCEDTLKRFGVEVTYYDPLIGAKIADLIQPNTKVIFTESPGSQTMEIQDIPAIGEVARKSDILVMMDNTWATSIYFDALKMGVDITLQAVTKYISGNSDLLMGAVTARTEEQFKILRDTNLRMGTFVSPDDITLAARGLRTLRLRLEHHMKSGLEMAEWFRSRPEVAEVLHPGLPGAPGHDLWKRDFKGACSLFSVVLKPCKDEAVFAMLNTLKIFGMGASWGGFESLVTPFNPKDYRVATQWPHDGISLRFHIGLEDTADLIADLEAGFEALHKA